MHAPERTRTHTDARARLLRGAQERFYFGDNVLPLFESGIPLLLQRLRALPDASSITIAYPDEGASASRAGRRRRLQGAWGLVAACSCELRPQAAGQAPPRQQARPPSPRPLQPAFPHAAPSSAPLPRPLSSLAGAWKRFHGMFKGEGYPEVPKP